MYAMLDIVIDNYIYIISNLGDKIEALEVDLLDHPNQNLLEAINTLKLGFNVVTQQLVIKF